MAEIKLTLEETLKIKESIEWGYNYYTEELNQLGYTHQVKDNNELEVYDENGNFVGKSFLGKEGQTSTRKFEAAMEVPEQVAELSNQLLLIKISLGYSERDIALLQQENLVQEPEAKYGSKEEVPARIFPAVEHGNLKNVASNRDKIIEEEKTLLLERKAAAVPFQQQVATMVRHIIENTKEAPQKERRIEEHHKKVSEKPQSVSTPQRQENPTFKKFESLIESAKADIHPIRMKSIKKTLDLISQKINEGNPQITQLISDFDPVQENHVMAGMTTKKAYAYDIMYKLLPQCNAIIQEERKQAFEQDKVPYIHLEWSESPIFPFENSYYSIKEFNELIENEDRRFYNERERIIQKYGSYEKYYAIPKEELPIEDRNVSLGYDKTKFQILNLPTMDKTDTISYGADRYDIGDGYGSIFDFVRETCTYPQVIEALNNLENELYFPSVSQEQKDKVQTIIEGNKKSLEKSLSNHLNLYHEVRMQEEEQRKSILVDITKTNLLKDQKKNALQNIKDSYNHSIASILGEAKSMDIPKEYAINETKKFVTGMLYTPPSSWNEMGEIWSLFPATCNFTETLQELYEQQTKVQPVREERTQDSLAIEIASNEKQLPENESPIEYPVGKYGQLELFAFEQTPSYNNSMKAVSQYITSGDPSLTKEHIWRAKAATRTYCNPILDGKKSGLWKNFRDFKKHGVLDILGANAEMEQGKITPQGWNQLATALQIYRDKRFETFRYLFVSPEGKIQDQLAVCSHLPGKTLSNLPSENLLGQVITHAEETGTKVVLVHNHPSGNITPSVDDIRMTKTTEAAFTRSDGKCLLAGHIILDHDSYSLYQKGKEWEARMLSPYDIYDPLLKIRNPMSAVKMYPEDFLTQNNAKLLSQLQETAKRTGAIMAFPIILDKNHISQENQKNLLDRMKAGCFTDFYLGEKDGSFRTSEDFNLIPGKNLFDEVGMEQMAEQTNITSTFPRHQKYEMESLGVFVAEEKKEYESFLGQIDDYLKRGKLPEYNRFILTQTPSILEFTGIPQNHVLLSTGVLNKARKIHGLDNKEIMDSVKGLFNPMLVFSSDKSTSEAKNDSILVITEATARNGKPLTLALELNKEMSSHRQSYVVNDIRSIHDRSIVAQNGVDILKKWTEKGLLRYYDDKKISDWLELRRVQFPLSLTKSDMSMIADKNTSVKTRSQFENSLEVKSSSTLSAEDLNYIHSDEFISRFGDWEKANRLEKLKRSESIILSSQILLNGKDYTESINKARSVYSKENIRELTKLANAIGKETLNNLRLEQNLDRYTHPKLLNYDLNKEFVLNLDGFKETSHHNILQKGHIEGIANIPQIIQEAKYISAEDNEDNRKPDITKFHYFALGIKIDNEDYTGKVVFAEKKNGEMYYDQSLSTIEKGNLIDNIMKKNKLETSFELEKAVKPINRRDSFQYYDKRLINICQVPQLPYLDENLIPTKKTIEAVKRGELYIQRQNQKSYMVDTTVNPLSRHTPLHLESDLPEKLLTPAQVREGKQELPVKQSFMVKNSFLPPMELAKNGKVQLYCSSEDLQNPISQNSQEIKPVVLEMTPKQAAVLVDASIKKQSMENRLSKQQLPLNLPAKSKMEESFFTGLKNVHPQLTRKEAERQYHEVYSMIEKELKDLRIAPAIERKTPQRKDFSMEW